MCSEPFILSFIYEKDFMMKIIKAYFSPTGGTKKIIDEISLHIKNLFHSNEIINEFDFTLPDLRKKTLYFDKDDLVVIGVPVYAGRVPNVLLKYLKSIQAKDALCVAVVSYGNRDFDDALIELNDIMISCGFKMIALGAFIAEHSFSKILASQRPDLEDLKRCYDFSKKIVEKIKDVSKNKSFEKDLSPKGQRPYRFYYTPKSKEGEMVDFKKIKPKTNDSCVDCKLCFNTCPMGSISYDIPSLIEGICIKCGSCIKKCPVEAKYFDDHSYLYHKEELEINFSQRKEPVFFL